MPTRGAPPIVLFLLAPMALAQGNLGELVDAGARRMSIEEFRQELVQRVVVGPTASGGNLEIMYAANGSIQGRGTSEKFRGVPLADFQGEWKPDDSGRVCSSIGMRRAQNPLHCQFWFKHGEIYFVSDSATDRSSLVLARTMKQ